MKLQRKWEGSRIVLFLIGFAGAAALFDTLSIMGETARQNVAASHSFLSFWFGMLSAVIFEKVCQQIKERKRFEEGLSLAYSLALSLALVVGKRLETVENFDITDLKAWIIIAVLTIYFTPFVIYLWKKIEKAGEEKEVTEKNESKKSHMLRNWCVIFLCWIPVFLAFCPGAFVYDAYDEFIQVRDGIYTTHHPLAHVLLLGGMVMNGWEWLQSYNAGIAAYTMFQMVLLSGVFAYTIEYVRQKIKNMWAERITLAFYGVFPVIPMYAVCSSKDGIFTATFLVVVIKILQLLEKKEEFLAKKGNVIATILASVIMMLFRNNGLYAYGVWLAVIVFVNLLLKTDGKVTVKTAGIMMTSILLFLLCSKILAAALGADDSESQEIMTVPIQQMVRTYVYSPETYTEEEKELLFELIPEEDMDLYNARLSDLVKSKFNNQTFNQNKMKYLSLWMKIGLKKPMIYLNAWLMTSYGYWYPDAVINVYGGNAVYTFTYKDSSYFGFETEYPGIRESKFPWLEEQYRRMSLELYQQKVPAVSMLFSPGCLFWVFMFVLCFLMQKGSWDKVLPLCGILMLWLTAVLGPTYLVRYVLILWFALPVLAAETKE